jgi:hypothetical protein
MPPPPPADPCVRCPHCNAVHLKSQVDICEFQAQLRLAIQAKELISSRRLKPFRPFQRIPAEYYSGPTPPALEASDLASPKAPATEPQAKGLKDRAKDVTREALALGAALDLKKEGKPVSLRAVCKRAGVDRKNLRERHPDTVRAIEALAQPDRAPRRGAHDRRTGNLDAIDDENEE